MPDSVRSRCAPAALKLWRGMDDPFLKLPEDTPGFDAGWRKTVLLLRELMDSKKTINSKMARRDFLRGYHY